MRERTLFDSILFKGVFVISLIAVFSLNIYWGWGEILESYGNSLIQLSISNLFIDLFFKISLLLGIALTIPMIGRKFKLIERSRNVTLFILIFFFVLLSTQNYSLNTLISGLLIIVFFNIFLKIYNQTSIKKLLFYASMVVSLLSFLNYINIVFLIALWIGFSIIRPFYLKNFFVSIIAFALPWLYYFAGMYLWGSIKFDLNFAPNITFNLTIIEWVVFTIIIIASVHSVSFRSKMIAHQRNQMTFMLIVLVVSLVLSFVFDKQYLLLASLPTSFFLSNLYFNIKKKWILDVFALLIVWIIPLLKFI